MIFLNQSFKGLKITIKPKKVWRDKRGNPRKTEGEHIKFEDGVYRTDDPVKIKFLQDYMSKHKNEIQMINEEELARRKRIEDKVTVKMELIDKLSEFGFDPDEMEEMPVKTLQQMLKEAQDDVDRTPAEEKEDPKKPAKEEKDPQNEKAPDVTSPPPPEDKEEPEEKGDDPDLNDEDEFPDIDELDLQGMIDLADDYGIDLSDEELKNEKLLREKLINELYEDEEEVGGPNLEDESGKD
jgi:hypothetical protein